VGISKQATQKSDKEGFLYDDVNVSRAWESITENIKI
jgi:hypothetical protein